MATNRPLGEQTTPTSAPPSPSPPVDLPGKQAVLAEPVAATFSLCSPLAEHSLTNLPQIISAPYDPPPPGHEERHHGVDFAYYRDGKRPSILGEAVQAVLPGIVAMSLNDRFPYGNALMIETPGDDLPASLASRLGLEQGESLYILYAHLELPSALQIGDSVQPCQTLGAAGQSGNAGVPHLHVETRLGPPGVTFQDMLFYNTRETPEQMENYVRWRTSGEFRHFDPMLLLSFEPDQ